MTGIFLTADPHNFEHLAQVPWPQFNHFQLDWVQAMDSLEQWLERHIGPHNQEWAYAHQRYDYWCAHIAFRQARSKTLFLLAWT